MGLGEEDNRGDLRPIQAGHFCQGVDNGVSIWPREMHRIRLGAVVDISWGMLEDEVAICLLMLISNGSLCPL